MPRRNSVSYLLTVVFSSLDFVGGSTASANRPWASNPGALPQLTPESQGPAFNRVSVRTRQLSGDLGEVSRMMPSHFAKHIFRRSFSTEQPMDSGAYPEESRSDQVTSKIDSVRVSYPYRVETMGLLDPIRGARHEVTEAGSTKNLVKPSLRTGASDGRRGVRKPYRRRYLTTASVREWTWSLA